MRNCSLCSPITEHPIICARICSQFKYNYKYLLIVQIGSYTINIWQLTLKFNHKEESCRQDIDCHIYNTPIKIKKEINNRHLLGKKFTFC